LDAVSSECTSAGFGYNASSAATGVTSLMFAAPSHDEQVRPVPMESNGELTEATLRELHRWWDFDGDGRASMAELVEFAQAMRHVLARRELPRLLLQQDLNRDGELSLREVLLAVDPVGGGDEKELRDLKGRKRLEKLKFQHSDADGNGRLDREEAAALFFPETHPKVLEVVAKYRLHALDADQSGKLCPREFFAIGAIDGDGLEMMTREEEADFARLDRDQDGALSTDELLHWESGEFHVTEAMRELFEVADSDRDDRLSAQELLAARSHIAARDAQLLFMNWIYIRCLDRIVSSP